MSYDPGLLISPRYFIRDLIDIDKLTELLELYSNATGMVTALLDLQGNVLIATNWQDSCTQFHRKNETTCANCLESDTALASQLAEGKSYNVYRCKNGLVDVATPVVIDGQHVGNLFTGQFFFEKPNLEEFRQKARQVGFDEDDYINAIQKVPVYSEDEIEAHCKFLVKLAQMFGELGAANIKVQQANREVTYKHQLLSSSFAQFVEIAPIGIVKIDGDSGRLLLTNDAFISMLDIEPDILLTKALADLVVPSDQQSLKDAWRQLPSNYSFGPLELKLERRDGAQLNVLLYAVMTAEASGEQGVWTIIQNITQTKQLEERLTDARVAAESASKAKSDFLANMSHEIRTPMNGIMGTLQLLDGKVTDSQNQELVSKSLYSARALLTIINDILDFSKIEAGKLSLESIPFSLTELIDSVMADLRLQADKKQLTLECIVEDAIHDSWLGDPFRLRQVLLNLGSNAIKFTHHGTVTLSFKQCTLDSATALHISVADTGIGMDEEGMKAVFERFEQADSSTTRHFGGTGLGMAITKHLVELMSGSIQVASQKGHGTTFSVNLPLKQTEQQAVEQSSEQGLIPNLTSKCILVAEDNEINRLVVLNMLEPTNATVHFAVDGEKAVAAYQKYRPDLVLMDIQMPNMDGIEACRQIKAMNGRVPVIALTASVMREDIESYSSAGFDGYLGKPMDLPLLYKALHQAV
jgi:PAS domain S-box-containing protein